MQASEVKPSGPSPHEEFQVSVLNPSSNFGALLSVPITAAQLLGDPALASHLVKVWQEYGGLLILRGLTDMTARQLDQVSSLFGEVEQELEDGKQAYEKDGVCSVMTLGNVRNGTGELEAVFAKGTRLPPDGSCQYRPDERKPVWHTDGAHRKSPPAGSLLFCKQAPPEGAETCFADMRSAYDDMDSETQAHVENLECVCSLMHRDAKVRLLRPEYPVMDPKERAANPPVRVPMVMTHPVTGRRALYGLNSSCCFIVPKGSAVPQEHMDKAELEAFEDPSVQREWRNMLRDVTSSRYTVVWDWQPGDLAVWDNRSLIHCGTGFDSEKYVREMWRTTLSSYSAKLFSKL